MDCPVEQIDPLMPEFVAIAEALDAFHDSLYPAECNAKLNPHDMLSDRVFVYAVKDSSGRLLSCGVLDARNESYPELKRFYTVPEYRSKGLAGRILETVFAKARELNLSAIYLETGNRQPAALAMYKKYGFVETGPFASYSENGFSVFLCKSLIRPGR